LVNFQESNIQNPDQSGQADKFNIIWIGFQLFVFLIIN